VPIIELSQGVCHPFEIEAGFASDPYTEVTELRVDTRVLDRFLEVHATNQPLESHHQCAGDSVGTR
jgi:hypothetical protein